MKTLITAILTLASVNAFSASIQILETTNFSSPYVQGSFGINEEMGRAWAELAIDNSVGSDSSPEYVKVKVAGLSLVGESVVLDIEGQQVECAKVRPVGIFRYRVAKSTGKCVFKAKSGKKVIDDGFETRTIRTLVVSLETR